MKVGFAVLHYDEAVACADPVRYLARVPIHRELPAALATRGHAVHVVHLYPTRHELTLDGVRHHFVAAGRIERALAHGVGRLRQRDPAVYLPALGAIRTLRSLNLDLIHFHGLTLTWNLALTLRSFGASMPPLVLHYHGGGPARNWLARRLQRDLWRHAARCLFTTRDHARPFVEAGLLEAGQIAEFVETSSPFRPRDRTAARRETGMTGEPVFLWVGRLAPIKDPFTVLAGFERLLDAWPRAELYLYYRTDDLLPDLRAWVAARTGLAGQVHFRGQAPFEQMEAIYNSADFLLQGSRREFSGCAVLEAMSCGVVPVVTDIPSFRAMTDAGRYGILFPPGDADTLARRVLACSPEARPRLAAAIRDHFARRLSFAALGEQLDRIYATIER